MDGVSFLLYYKIKTFFRKNFTQSSQRNKDHKEGRGGVVMCLFHLEKDIK